MNDCDLVLYNYIYAIRLWGLKHMETNENGGLFIFFFLYMPNFNAYRMLLGPI